MRIERGVFRTVLQSALCNWGSPGATRRAGLAAQIRKAVEVGKVEHCVCALLCARAGT